MTNSIECIAPSNIALVKYWGKKDIQIPQNPSLSFTLNESVTRTKVLFEKGKGNTEFLFEGKHAPSFETKISTFRSLWENKYPSLKNYDLKIESQNSFPHSAGIASSASSMASLSLCFSELLKNEGALDLDKNSFLENASNFARLGSGSACRSLYGGVVTWGQWREGTSNEYATETPELSKKWSSWGDAILLVSSKEKPVSSRQGHALMIDHPYAESRFSNARNRLTELYKVMLEEELFRFCEIVETEALELHGLMMNSNPSFILMKPESLAIIEKVRHFRNETKIPACFTLDAGPNIHLLYPLEKKAEVRDFINNELSSFLEEGKWIDDKVGMGPEVFGAK